MTSDRTTRATLAEYEREVRPLCDIQRYAFNGEVCRNPADYTAIMPHARAHDRPAEVLLCERCALGMALQRYPCKCPVCGQLFHTADELVSGVRPL